MEVCFDAVTIERGGRALVRDLDLAFDPRTFTAVVGANGVGKTSLLATLAGITLPARGRVLLDGHDLARLAAHERARAVAFVEPAEAVLGAVTVAEAVAAARFPHHRWWEWYATARDDARIAQALDAADLHALRERRLATLSAGERGRVWIALAIAQEAPVVALDEPTAHLDLRYASEVLERLHDLARAGATIVAALHALDEAAAYADRVLLLGPTGVVADGPPATALTRTTLRRAFGVDIAVVRDGDALAFRRERNGPATHVADPSASRP